MCHPALYIAAGAMQLAGGFMQAQQEKKTAEYQGQLLDEQARQELVRGSWEADRKALQTRQTIGTQRALYGASGAEVGSGTPLQVTEDTAMLGAADESMIRLNAARRAWGLGEQKKMAKYEGKLRAKQAIWDGFTGALTSGANAWGSYKTTPKKPKKALGDEYMGPGWAGQ